jgi:hypothetical protein
LQKLVLIAEKTPGELISCSNEKVCAAFPVCEPSRKEIARKIAIIYLTLISSPYSL